jgi:hypothetical protein
VPFEADVVKFEKIKNCIEEDIHDECSDTVIFCKASKVSSKTELELGGFDNLIEHRAFDRTSETVEEHFLTSSYEKVVNIFGRFQQESIALGLSELR